MHNSVPLLCTVYYFTVYLWFTGFACGNNLSETETAYLVLNYGQPGFNLQKVIQNYSRLRDMYRREGNDLVENWRMVYYPNNAVETVLAKFINATPISIDQARNLTTAVPFPEVVTLPSSYWQKVGNYRNETYPITDKIPEGVQLVLMYDIKYNFVYCDVSSKEKISIWEFSIFLNPFDKMTWGLLVTSFVLVAPISGKFSKVIMPMISATLSVGTIAPSRGSRMFIIWMCVCMLLANFYSGELTSSITVPPKDDVMTHFRHLQERHYTYALQKSHENSLKNLRSYWAKSPTEPGKVIAALLEKVALAEELYGFMIGGRYATIAPWPAALVFPWVHKFMIKTYRPYYTWSNKKCHVGQELAKMGEQFFIFLPPKNAKLVEGLQQLIQAGIYQRWIQEEDGLLHSERVQDRVRVKSPTKVVEMEVAEIPTVGLERKVITMFLLWGVCIVISFVGFCLEHIRFHNRFL